VPLVQLADIRVQDGATIIARRENERAVTVRTNIRGRDQGSYVADAEARLADAVKLPSGYTVNWGGQFEKFARARERLAVIMPITLGVIFALGFRKLERVRRF
jgi:cobalt-zinc-cadmium resistance protein CzcA